MKVQILTVKKQGRISKIANDYYNYRYFFIMLLPVVTFFLIFRYLPIYGVIIAFKDFMPKAGVWGSEWAGLKHFKKLFTGMYFLPVLRNTILISSYKLIFGFPAPIILALLLNEIRHKKFKKTVQTITYLPHFLSWVILAGILMEILSPSRGFINYILGLFGMEPIFFVANKEWFRTVLVGSGIWKEVGWQSIIYMAAITGINPELYDVANIDGAGRLRKMWSITLPSIAPVIVIMLILASGSLIKDDFDQVFNLLNVNVLSVGDVISTYTYREGISNMNYSYAAAVGLFKNVISFGLVLVTNTIAKRMGENSLF